MFDSPVLPRWISFIFSQRYKSDQLFLKGVILIFQRPFVYIHFSIEGDYDISGTMIFMVNISFLEVKLVGIQKFGYYK